jgi:hypothetical protein
MTVDLLHDVYGLEVTAIRENESAKAIEALLRRMFPGLSPHFLEDRNLRELGWKVLISRDPENFKDSWAWSAENLQAYFVGS